MPSVAALAAPAALIDERAVELCSTLRNQRTRGPP